MLQSHVCVPNPTGLPSSGTGIEQFYPTEKSSAKMSVSKLQHLHQRWKRGIAAGQPLETNYPQGIPPGQQHILQGYLRVSITLKYSKSLGTLLQSGDQLLLKTKPHIIFQGIPLHPHSFLEDMGNPTAWIL